tara:strand:+ start:1369 stop:1548 length:180 start_codon:yes stop_codon:yes gene_type:complete
MHNIMGKNKKVLIKSKTDGYKKQPKERRLKPSRNINVSHNVIKNVEKSKKVKESEIFEK